MEKVYQIRVTGSYVGFPNDTFKMSSKKVYRRYPTQEDIDEFIDRCAKVVNDFSMADLYCLDASKPYETRILELTLVD